MVVIFVNPQHKIMCEGYSTQLCVYHVYVCPSLIDLKAAFKTSIYSNCQFEKLNPVNWLQSLVQSCPP